MANTKITNVEGLVETKYLSLYKLDVVNKVGNNKEWLLASRKDIKEVKDIYLNKKEHSIDAVLIVPIHKETGKLVLVKQIRVPINDFILELPAGLIDDEEDFSSAVEREIKEETGLDLISINRELTKQNLYVSPGMTDESVALVYCICSGELSADYLEVDEEIEPIMISKEEAKEILNNNSYKLDIRACLIMRDYIDGKLDFI